MFKVNDLVFIEELLAYGKIAELNHDSAIVEFTTGTGGGCLPFEISELKPVWCITTDGLCDKNEKMYLAWQNPAWDEDGYFWTSKETMKEVLYNNVLWHRFLFHSRNAAIKHLKTIDIPQKCRIAVC